MKNIYILLLIFTSFSILNGQNTPINKSIKMEGEAYYYRMGTSISKITPDSSTNFFFGQLYDPIFQHETSNFLNFDIKGSLMITTEYINDYKNSSLNPNRFRLVLKSPKLGDPIWRTDLRRFDIEKYLPKNLENFYYDLVIINDYLFNFYLLFDGKLIVYEIIMDEDYSSIQEFNCTNKIKIGFEDYFNVFPDSDNNFHLFNNGNYFRIKNKKLEEEGIYNNNDFLIFDKKNNKVFKINPKEEQNSLFTTESIKNISFEDEVIFKK